MMKQFFGAMALAIVLSATPVMAGASLVFYFKRAEGEFTYRVWEFKRSISLADCRRSFSELVPQIRKKIEADPALAGWRYSMAECEVLP